MARAEVRGALGLDHEGREGVLAGADAPGLGVLRQRVRGVFPVPALAFVLLNVPYTEYGVLLLVHTRPVPDALLAPGAVRGHRFWSGAAGAGAQLVGMLQLLLAVSARFVICEDRKGGVSDPTRVILYRPNETAF